MLLLSLLCCGSHMGPFVFSIWGESYPLWFQWLCLTLISSCSVVVWMIVMLPFLSTWFFLGCSQLDYETNLSPCWTWVDGIHQLLYSLKYIGLFIFCKILMLLVSKKFNKGSFVQIIASSSKNIRTISCVQIWS